MTDQEIIQGLIARDNRVTEEFFYVKCRPLFKSIIMKVFDYDVDYDEFVNELYLYLMEEDASKLNQFQYRCSLYMWLKILAIRFFIKRRSQMIYDASHETLYEKKEYVMEEKESVTAGGDLERLFRLMPTPRYAYVIQKLVIEDWEPEQLAQEMNITTANLYNIKRRAIAQLTSVALNDIKEYGK